MRRTLCSIFVVSAAAIAAAPGPSQGTGGVHAAAAPTRTLTGVLSERLFIHATDVYPWVIDKNGHVSEVNVAAVVPKLNNFRGQRVRATGTWSTYLHNGEHVPYLIVTQLEPA